MDMLDLDLLWGYVVDINSYMDLSESYQLGVTREALIEAFMSKNLDELELSKLQR